MRIPAFVNPASGGGEAAVERLRESGRFDVVPVEPGELARGIRTAIADGAKRICVAGGDGSVAAAASALAGTDAELAIVPAGTLNHLARDLGIPVDIDEAVRVATDGVATPVDVGRAGDRLFINTSSVGAYVTFVRLRERLERYLGYWAASFVASVRLLWTMRTFRVHLEVDGRTREYVTPLVFVGVSERELALPHLGARLPDGRRGLHVFVVRTRGGARLLALAFAAAARGLEWASRTPALDAFLVDRCRIDAPFHTIATDGELVTATFPLEYTHARGAVNVVLPPKTTDAA